MGSDPAANRNGQAPWNPDREPAVPSPVIRVAIRVEPLEAPRRAEEAFGLPCSGRCGHCDLHPCRLHGPI